MKGTSRLVWSLVFVGVIVATVIGLLFANIRPVLGLDLTGGVSVVLQGPAGTSKGVMEQALERIRSRVDALGVAEPDISLLGSNQIQVQLPGLGGQGTVKKVGTEWCVYNTQGSKVSCHQTEEEAKAKAASLSIQRVLDLIGKTARLEERPVLQIVAPSTDPKSAYQTTKLTPGDPQNADIWSYFDSNKDGQFQKGKESLYQLGPVVITGANLKKAQAVFVSAGSTTGGQTGWQVSFTLDGQGTSAFSTITQSLATKTSGDPTKQLAIVLDHAVVSSPEVQSAITNGQGVITGGFSETQAKNLAVLLQAGSLPVQLKRLTVETVSPTLGKTSLHQGLIAGLVGLVALMLYLAFYYRLLGIVTWVGMTIWAILALGLVSILGHTAGYALSLAGVAGLIVSLGITADSYIVFYERLKDEVRGGKTFRTAVQPAFRRAWRTIVAADIVTGIAAAVLYVVSIGSVRGFALTLGLSTILDLFVVWFFKRSAVFLMSRSAALTGRRGIGLLSAVAADEPSGSPAVALGRAR